MNSVAGSEPPEKRFLLVAKDSVSVPDLRSTAVSFEASAAEQISIGELKSRLTSRRIIDEVLGYDEAAMVVDDVDLYTKPFASAAALRLLSKHHCYVIDIEGQSKRIGARTLGRYGKERLRTLVATPRKKHARKQDVERLAETMRERSTPQFDTGNRPVYVRSDLWANVKSGGSVAHTAGVLNNLGTFCGPPLLLSAHEVPTLNESVERRVVEPLQRYRDAPAFRDIQFNRRLVERGTASLCGDPIGFVYNRYHKNSYAGLALAEEFDVPFVLEYNGSTVWINENWGQDLPHPGFARQVEQLNLHAADLVVVVSQPLVDELTTRGVERDRILLNPNGVDTEMYAPDINDTPIRREYDMDDETVIGFIGSFREWHGAEVLAEAFGQWLRENPDRADDVRLLLIGDGPKLERTREIVADYDVTQEVVVTGRVPQEEGPQYLAAADVLVSPHVPNPDGSEFFGSPTKLFEYMAMEKAIVASDLAQIGDVLDHKRTALLVDPGDPTALATAIQRLVDDPDLRSDLGDEARQQVVTEHSWEQHTRRIVDRLDQRVNQ